MTLPTSTTSPWQNNPAHVVGHDHRDCTGNSGEAARAGVYNHR